MEREQWVFLVPRPVREFPLDLLSVVLWVVLTDLVLLVGIGEGTGARVALGLPFVLVLPGYVLMASLLPERDIATPIERVVLSVGLSIAAVPLVGLALNFSPWGVRPVPVISSLSAFTLVTAAIATARRFALPPDDRFAVPLATWVRGTERALFGPTSRRRRALNASLSILVLVAVLGLGGAIASSGNGESFTELSLLTRSPAGQLVADEYPTELGPGEEGQVIVAIENHEGEPITYSVVVVAEPLRSPGRLGPAEVVDRFDVTVPPGDARRTVHAVEPPVDDTRERRTYLLYREPPPAEPTRENAYRAVHLWVSVEPA